MKLTWGGQEQELVDFVAMMADECYQGRYDTTRVLAEIENPRFDNRGYGGWRRRVPEGFVENWDRLSEEVRLAVFAMAIIRAD